MYKGRLARRLGGLPRSTKKWLFVCFDGVALLVLLWASFSLRLGHFFSPSFSQALLMLAAPAIAIPIFVRMGLYRSVLRYLPERAIWTILAAVTVAVLAWVSLAFLTRMTGLEGIPRSVPVYYWALERRCDRRQPVRCEMVPVRATRSIGIRAADADLRNRGSRRPTCDCADQDA